MNAKQKRLRFVFVLSSLATVYGGILAYRLLHYQADVVSDIIKMAVAIFILTVIASYFWWTAIRWKLSGPQSGALAAVLTGISVIPAPTFMGAFKGVFLADYNLIAGVQAGLKYSLSTFSAAEALALPLCAIAGYVLAR